MEKNCETVHRAKADVSFDVFMWGGSLQAGSWSSQQLEHQLQAHGCRGPFITWLWNPDKHWGAFWAAHSNIWLNQWTSPRMRFRKGAGVSPPCHSRTDKWWETTVTRACWVHYKNDWRNPSLRVHLPPPRPATGAQVPHSAAFSAAPGSPGHFPYARSTASGILCSPLLLLQRAGFELSWSILERGMLFIFVLCIFCLGLLIPFIPWERQLPQ